MWKEATVRCVQALPHNFSETTWLDYKTRISQKKIKKEMHYIVTNSLVLFHNGSLLHSKFNTQLLITVHNSPRILTHV
jgi:hypothetical protein